MNRFDSKGVQDGDPIAIAIFVVFLFVILTWLLSSSSPLPSNQRSATAANVVNQFRFVLLIIVPITVIGLFRQFGSEDADQFKREVNEAQLAFTRGLSAKIAEFNARQHSRKKPKKGPLSESETL